MITYITNAKNNGTTQRLLDFNAACKFGDNYLFATDANLISLGGDSDAGSTITSYFEPVTTDFGIPNPKSGRFVHVGFETDGDLEVDITFDGKTTETITLTPQNSKTGQQRITKEISRAGQGRYATVQVRNASGSDYSIDSFEVEFYILPIGLQDY